MINTFRAGSIDSHYHTNSPIDGNTLRFSEGVASKECEV